MAKQQPERLDLNHDELTMMCHLVTKGFGHMCEEVMDITDKQLKAAASERLTVAEHVTSKVLKTFTFKE